MSAETEVVMILMRTEVEVGGISGRTISDFMLNCTDEGYQNWWPGTHLAFHTTNRFPNDLGNLVYFDEYLGSRRLKFEAVVIRIIPGKEIVWQMKKVLRWPAWLVLEFRDSGKGVVIAHTLKVGFGGIGKLLDPLLRLYLTKGFEKDLEKHAHIEFTKLSESLS
jgi:hypothetical protein